MKKLETLLQVKEMITQLVKIIAVDLSKQQILNANSRANQQINFTGNLDRAGNTKIYFILEETKETKQEFHKDL